MSSRSGHGRSTLPTEPRSTITGTLKVGSDLVGGLTIHAVVLRFLKHLLFNGLKCHQVIKMRASSRYRCSKIWKWGNACWCVALRCDQLALTRIQLHTINFLTQPATKLRQ